MKQTPRLLIAAILLLSIAGAAYWFLRPSMRQEIAVTASATEVGDDIYTCPMHPSVRSDRPGACPVCGMALVKRSTLGEASPQELKLLEAVSLSPTQRVLANVSTVPVTRRDIARRVKAVGTVTIAEPLQATVAARFRGRIERLYANATGLRVQRGAPLFELYSPDLVSAEQEFLLALEGSAARPSDSGQANLSDRLLEASRTRLRVNFGLTEEQVRELEQQRHVHLRLPFYSPLGGTVMAKEVQEGQYVEEGMVLYRLADLSRVWVVLDVYEQDIRFVREGQPVEIAATSYPGRSFSGRVTFVEPTVNDETRTVRVRAELANTRGELKPNMYVTATLQVSAQQTFVVPSSAVLATGPRNIVWVEVGQNTFEPRDVTVGIVTEEAASILTGVREGERVAATGGYLIDSESTLRRTNGGGGATGHDHETSQKPAEGGATTGLQEPQDAQVVTILVKGSYQPSTVRVKAGRPILMRFQRDEDSRCTDEVVFPTLNIRKALPAWKTTSIRLRASEPGEIPFECGMSMVTGTLIVER